MILLTIVRPEALEEWGGTFATGIDRDITFRTRLNEHFAELARRIGEGRKVDLDTTIRDRGEELLLLTTSFHEISVAEEEEATKG